jgi:hypothetical protein
MQAKQATAAVACGLRLPRVERQAFLTYSVTLACSCRSRVTSDPVHNFFPSSLHL